MRRDAVKWMIGAAVAGVALVGAGNAMAADEPAPSTTIAVDTEPRINGGRPAADGEFPWATYLSIQTNTGLSSCTGTLISPQIVLSAAHCLTETDGSLSPGLNVIAVIGKTDKSPPYDAANEVYGVGNLVAVHPNYSLDATGFQNDLALLRLDRPATGVRGMPMMRPERDALQAPGTRGTIAGWSNISQAPSVSTDRLHIGTAQIRTDQECSAQSTGYVAGKMNCTSPPLGGPVVVASTCKGDSGGPLVVPFGNDYMLSGVTSFGPSPCQATRFGGYAKVSAYVDWIVANTAAPGFGAPVATTGGTVAERRSDGFTVSGTIDPNMYATGYEVAWGTTPALTGGVARGYAGMGPDPQNIQARITGAPAGSEIFYRFRGLNGAGISEGAIRSANTDSAPAPPPPPAAPVALASAPFTGSPLCNAAPRRTPGTKGTIRLTSQALAIQQRIDAAALRRLNAANYWMDKGIVPTDLCAGALGQPAFQAGIGWVGRAPVDTTPPSPRKLDIVKKNKKAATFTVDLRQIRINNTISLALLACAEATRARINGLTGGNLAPGTKLSRRPLYPGLGTSGALPPSQSMPATPLSIGKLPAAGELTVSVAQLKKTQQRSQKAIMIANEVNDRITQGLTGEQFKDGSIGSSALS